MGIDPAQVRLDQATRDFAGMRRRDVQTFQDAAAEVKEILVAVASRIHAVTFRG